jgi:NAD(P)-dependent dehydrogenase (short-subunit alcohol dehydrogenase family)
MKLNGKTALITGGTTGIGLETARLLQSEGARVIVTGVNAERMAEAREVLGKEVLVLAADLRKAGDLDTVFETVKQRFGKLDILFANAGVGTVATLDAVTEEQIDTQFSINFKGAFFTVQKATPLMGQGQGGSIVLTTSFLNEIGAPGFSILSASKAAVRSLARSLGAELAPRGIRVNAVSPGPIATNFHSKLGLTDAQLGEAAASIQASIPLGRFGDAGEIANAVLFLASDDASFMTGAELVADGGLSQF